MDLGKGAGPRAGALRFGGAGVGVAKDGALSDEHNVLASELLLQLPGELDLDFVDGLEKLERNVDDDSLLSSSDIDLLSGRDVKVLEGSLQLVVAALNSINLLGDALLEVVGDGAPSLSDSVAHFYWLINVFLAVKMGGRKR